MGQTSKTQKKNNFSARWFKNEDECLISDSLKTKILKYTNNLCMNGMNVLPKPIMQMNSYTPTPNSQFNNYYPNNIWGPGTQGKQNGYTNNANSYTPYGVYNNYNTNSSPYTPSSSFSNVQRKSSTNSGTSNTMENSNPNLQNYDEKKGQQGSGGNVNGKYTCRFEMQIENDKDFQVARRLIGAKGCNMKKIVEMCGKNQDGSITQDVVKLRLRGKGSGYKEGPFNRESDEALHLCISSKFPDRYKYACNLVQELVYSVYEEYKKYCTKTNKVPVSCLAIRKEEGISSNSRKKSEFEL